MSPLGKASWTASVQNMTSRLLLLPATSPTLHHTVAKRRWTWLLQIAPTGCLLSLHLCLSFALGYWPQISGDNHTFESCHGACWLESRSVFIVSGGLIAGSTIVEALKVSPCTWQFNNEQVDQNQPMNYYNSINGF